jgi:hypothetical protein
MTTGTTEPSAPLAPTASPWRRPTIGTAVEIILPVILGFFLQPWQYITIGRVAALRGIDHGGAILTSLDRAIPIVPIFAIPYVSVWFSWIVVYAAVIYVRGFDPGPFRRFNVAVYLSMTASAIIWVLWPTSAAPLYAASPIGDGPLMSWVTGLRGNLETFNQFPSYHVCNPWITTCFAGLHFKRGVKALWVLTVLVALSTVFVKAHYILDPIAGAALGAVMGSLLRRLEERRAFEGASSLTAIVLCALYFAALLPAALLTRR